MNTIAISPLKKEPVVCFSGENIDLPLKEQSVIDIY
jgi:hypothetical protein